MRQLTIRHKNATSLVLRKKKCQILSTAIAMTRQNATRSYKNSQKTYGKDKTMNKRQSKKSFKEKWYSIVRENSYDFAD